MAISLSVPLKAACAPMTIAGAYALMILVSPSIELSDFLVIAKGHIVRNLLFLGICIPLAFAVFLIVKISRGETQLSRFRRCRIS